jgi:energy-coupling factor transport system substrate-specific component
VYVTVCGLHGILFGVLYAPVQALFFGFSWKQMLAWVAAGFPFDVIHGIGNCVMGLLILPLSRTLAKLEKRASL